MKAPEWETTRDQFPVLRQWVYLDSASFGPAPRCAHEAAEQHARRRDERASLDFISWFDDADRVRALAATMIHAAPQDIAFIPNTATPLGWLVNGLAWRPGGHMLARRGLDFVEVPVPDGAFSLERFCSHINERTRLVLMSTVNYSTGLRPPVEQIGAILKERGVLYFLDATQSLGALRLDVNAARADVVAAHAYKWLLSPAGIGLAYIRPAVREWLQPSIFSWRSHKDWRRVDALHHGPPELPSEALKYEGGLQNFPGIYALGAVLEMMLELGVAEIEERVTQLAELARQVLRRSGGALPNDRLPHYDSSIVAAQFPGADVSRLARQLQEKKVVVSARHGHLRVSPHFFNSEQDLARLEESLHDLVA